MTTSVPQLVNEIMFIAIAKPDQLDVTVEYRSLSDCINVRVMPSGFNYKDTTLEEYSAAMLLAKDIFLDYSNALTELSAVKDKLLDLIKNSQGVEVAA